jgi:hypothetical protein
MESAAVWNWSVSGGGTGGSRGVPRRKGGTGDYDDDNDHNNNNMAM